MGELLADGPAARSLRESYSSKVGARTVATVTRPAIQAAVANHRPKFFRVKSRERRYAATAPSKPYSCLTFCLSRISAATMPWGW